MQLVTEEIVARPAKAVFAVLTDFDLYRDLASGRGIVLERTDTLATLGDGAAWQMDVPIRGHLRRVSSRVTGFRTDEWLEVCSDIGGTDCVSEVHLTPMPDGRTRTRVALELRPRSLKGRLLVQSLKLAKGNLNARFAARIARIARELERRATP